MSPLSSLDAWCRSHLPVSSNPYQGTRSSSNLKHFFNWETWNTSCTPERLGGNPKRYATSPFHSNTLNGPIYLGASFPFTLNLRIPLIGETFRYTWTLLRTSAYLFCLVWAILKFFRTICRPGCHIPTPLQDRRPRRLTPGYHILFALSFFSTSKTGEAQGMIR